MMASVNIKTISLDAFQEVSVSVFHPSETVSVELLEGSAEIFGVEMIKNVLKTFSSSFAVTTSLGCSLKFVGNALMTNKRSTNSVAWDIHTNLQKTREKALIDDKRGPVVLITGPKDVGKSTLTRSLLNYAVRCNMQPIFIDLDVGQSSISLPGTVGILPADCPGDIVKGYCDQNVSVYFFGHKGPGFNMLLYMELIKKLSETLCNRLSVSSNIFSSGAIIDTCGWVKQQGYLAILHAAKCFKVSAVFVLNDRDLYSTLKKDLPSSTEILFLDKLDGVKIRSQAFRANKRNALIHEYFYGTDLSLKPESFEISYQDFSILKICCLTGELNPNICNEPLKYLATNKVCINDLKINQVLAISYAKVIEEVMTASVLGFILIQDIDCNNKVLKVLSPRPAPLPNNILIAGDIFYEK